MIRERRLYFHSEGSRATDFCRPWPGLNPRIRLQFWRWNIGADKQAILPHYMFILCTLFQERIQIKICLRMKCQNDYEKCLVIARFYLSESTQMLEQCSVCVVGVSVIYPTADIRYRSSYAGGWCKHLSMRSFPCISTLRIRMLPSYRPQITSWSLRCVNVLSVVWGWGEYRACRWTEDFLLVSDKDT
jgi:hypothetical protein